MGNNIHVVCGIKVHVLKILSKEAKKIKYNYIWASKDQENARAKVAWKAITQITRRKGMGLIDPWQQSKALLCKFVVRCMQTDAGPWSKYLLDCIGACTPHTDESWQM